LLHALHLAFAHGGHAVDLAGEPAVRIARQLHGQQMLHAQRLGDGAGDELVGGDDEHGVARILVLAHQRSAWGGWPGQSPRA
jgi:hypothetical protein